LAKAGLIKILNLNSIILQSILKITTFYVWSEKRRNVRENTRKIWKPDERVVTVARMFRH